MTTANIAYTTPTHGSAWKRWLLLSPGARIVMFFLAVAILGGGLGALAFVALAVSSGIPMEQWEAFGKTLHMNPWMYYAGQVIPSIVIYFLLVRFVERRRVQELAWRDLPRYGGGGLALGVVLFSLIVGILWLAGSYQVIGTHAPTTWLTQILVFGIGAGISEELWMRGALYRMVEEGLGTWAALVISALVFGFMHAGNPNATLWSSLAIAIEAGISFALLYHVTRSLWACLGLHAAWNIMQGLVYGIPVSGMPADGLLVSERSGPEWLSGGNFGAEASVVALSTCSVLTIILLVIAIRRGSIVAPFWVRRRRAAA